MFPSARPSDHCDSSPPSTILVPGLTNRWALKLKTRTRVLRECDEEGSRLEACWRPHATSGPRRKGISLVAEYLGRVAHGNSADGSDATVGGSRVGAAVALDSRLALDSWLEGATGQAAWAAAHRHTG
jgi:hypothetical protein